MVKIIVAPGTWSLRLRIGAAALGLSAGLTVGLYFLRVANVHVVFWGFFSAIWALGALLLHVFYKQGRLRPHATRLRTAVYAGLIGQLIGFSAFVVYIVLGIVFHDDLKNLRASYFVASVWAFMTWKWAFVIFWYSRQYRMLMLEEALIPVGGEETLYVDADQGSIISAPDVVIT
ncbi:hypothetical protein RvY_01443 [Ramazzottius varieornatus]|uniref:Uncharacterized protein n=1 Tax=Ramazzottius varieornatus TaxID=947166 RepID=A0A1D1UH84_RAMVA|nr:hypothetical protein RvY_01443 [Ramazzottius varieornatus]